MKDKGLVIAAIAVLVVIIIGVVIFSKPKAPKPDVQGLAAPAVTVKAGKVSPVIPAKKPISKDMGALTVKILGDKDKEVFIRARAFRAVDSRSSVLSTAFITSRTLELLPGTYDIEIETVPVKIYKGIKVANGRETVEDLGRPTGSFEVKAVNSAKKAIAYPVKVLYAKSNVVAASGLANRPMEIVAGVYDVEIASIPVQAKKDVRIDAGKEVSVDSGASGTLIVKFVDAAGKAVRGSARIKKSVSGELIASPAVNKPVDILPGLYTIEMMSKPPQVKNDVNIIVGEETSVDFAIQAPAVKPAAPKPAAPAKKPGV